jgi:hypothetical protein
MRSIADPRRCVPQSPATCSSWRFALEFSDGLVRQGGRIFYWTSVLFLPALLLLYGLVSERRWAWWTARSMTAIFTLWFVGFMAIIPFADLRGSDGPVPWWGRVYMVGVSLIFASMTAYAVHALGRAEARDYFALSNQTLAPETAHE